MDEQEREPTNEEVDDENREESPGEAVSPREGQQEKSHESYDTLRQDEKTGG
jgi:hypothetical protein